MKRIFFILWFIVLGFIVDGRSLDRINSHPRIFANNRMLDRVQKEIKSGKNDDLLMMHSVLLETAEGELSSPDVRSDVYAAGPVAVACTYAYRMLGEKRYLDRATEAVKYLCELSDWSPQHFLDVTQGAYACALFYDWLYDEISDDLKDMILHALTTKVLEPSVDLRYEHFLRKVNNWNQVCNAGVVLASICLYDKEPELAKAAIKASIERNRPIASRMFAPDGIYPEGAGYAAYGAAWQLAIISSLKTSFDDDFGLLASPGLDCLGDFIVASTGPTGSAFNFSDNTLRNAGWPMLYTLADLYDKPYYLYPERLLSSEKNYTYRGLNSCGGLLPMFILSAAHFSRKRIPEPPSTMFYGYGAQPLAVVRTGWDRDAMYLAIKGGNPALGHSHLDVGSFVFDAHGMRWADDIIGHSYKYYQEHLVDRRNLWKKTPDSPRWRLFRYNNLQHNTLTINSWDHAVTGYAPLVEVVDHPCRRGASFELTNAFKGMTMRVMRTAVIADGSRLEITDDIHASEDDVCEIVWNMATPAKAEHVGDGILLTQGGHRMKLTCDSPAVKWFVETSQQRAERASYGEWDIPVGDTMFCGYTITLKKSERVIITVTLQDVE